jgi:hypothetical protein
MNAEQVEPEWFGQWRSRAEKFSREEMQRLWGRILAQEVKRPGTFGYRTLEFLSTMSANDARAIEALAPFVVDQTALIAGFADLYSAHGLSMDAQIHLDAIGVLTGAATQLGAARFWTTSSQAADPYITIHFGATALVLFGPAGKVLTLPIASLTEVGRELMVFVDAKPNQDIPILIARKAKQEGFTRARRGVTVAGTETIVMLDEISLD